MWSELTWFMWIYFFLKLSEVKWVTVKFLLTKLPCTLGWPHTEGNWLYCDYFIWVFIWFCGCFKLLCKVWVCVCVCLCVFCNVWVFWQLCGYFGSRWTCILPMCTCIYCVLNCLYCVFVLFRLCIFIICFVCNSVRTTATEWKLNCSKYYYYYYY